MRNLEFCRARREHSSSRSVVREYVDRMAQFGGRCHRCEKSLLVFALYCFLLASKAWAGDYQVAYAIDARGLREAGKYVECIYGTACRLNFERTSIHILIGADGRHKPHFIVVAIYDGRNCCYFSDGGNSIQIDGDKPYHRLPIFEGKRRLRNEFVLNMKIGDIFLAFTDFR